jgi:flagellar assembly factor FliW
MKVLPEPNPVEADSTPANELILPQGIIGFPEYRRAELLYSADHLPFLWMRLHGPDVLHFVVVEPTGLIPGYEPEMFDEDASQLDLRDAADALVLNIVTIRRKQPLEATVNLIGPLVVNRRTRVGRQRVIANHSKYGAQHPLPENMLALAGARSA